MRTGSILVVAVCAVVAHAAVARADGSPAPLTEAEQAIFLGSEPDVLDKPKCDIDGKKRVTTKCRDVESYVHTNEFFVNEFKPYIREVGGGYVGVGSDQGLTLAAWARVELAWLIDYDPVVVAMNRIHRAFILDSEDIATYLARWNKDRATEADGRALLEREYADDPDLDLIVATFHHYRKEMKKYLDRIVKLGKRRRFHFLHDASDYAYVRGLYQAGRVRILGADLLKDKGVRGIGAAAKQLNVPIRVLYLSNAEQYWNYTPSFRDNIAALPLDDKSVLLRLLWNQRWGPEKLGPFFYVVQAGQDFQTRVQLPEVTRVAKLMRDRRSRRKGVFTLGMEPRRVSGK